MSGGDNIVINTRERAVSDDINDLQDVQYRTLMEMFRFGLAQNQVAESTVDTDVRAVVLGGLTVVPNGGDVTMQEGILMQDSLTLPPVPGLLDSSYRIGRLAAPLAVPIPAGEGFYLVEANMVEAIELSSTRDIFDPATETFVPTPVTKQTVQTLEATVTFGSLTNAPTPTLGNLICIAIVHKDAGGVIDQAIDLRPLQDDVPSDTYTRTAPTYIRNRWRRQDTGTITSAQTRLISFDQEVIGRRRMWMAPDDGVSSFAAFDAARWATPDAPAGPTGQRWVHFHMCEWFGYTPRTAYDGYVHQGVMVVDQNDRGCTSQGSRVTQAGIPLPAPFSAYSTLGNGDGVCVGALPYGLVNSASSPDETLGSGYMSDDGHVQGTSDDYHEFFVVADPGFSPGTVINLLSALILNNGAENPAGNAAFTVAPTGPRAFDIRSQAFISTDSDAGLKLVLADSTQVAGALVKQFVAVSGYGSAPNAPASDHGETGLNISLLQGTAPANLQLNAFASPGGGSTWQTAKAVVKGYWF